MTLMSLLYVYVLTPFKISEPDPLLLLVGEVIRLLDGRFITYVVGVGKCITFSSRKARSSNEKFLQLTFFTEREEESYQISA